MAYIVEDEEWELLEDLTIHNHMDTWFELVEDAESGTYVNDLESGEKMTLRDAIDQVGQGLVFSDLDLFENGKDIWNRLVRKLDLTEHMAT